MKSRPLDSNEREGLSAHREWINALLAHASPSTGLTGTRADLPTLHTLLDNGPYSGDAAAELQVFGTAFGDVVATELRLSWVVVDDDDGTDFALQFDEHQFFVFPQSMLIKRIERGEDVKEINLEFMLSELAKQLQEFLRAADA